MNNRVYKKGLALVLIIAIIIMAVMGIKLAGREKEIVFTDLTEVDTDEKDYVKDYIYVDIDGAVKNPGVYLLAEGSRVIDAINMAGGLEEGAFTRNINKAGKLTDGEKIYIPAEGESNAESFQSNNLININTASAELLMTLPGIGEVYAERIIEYRTNKKFSSIEEIKNIQGIGDKTFEKLKELISIHLPRHENSTSSPHPYRLQKPIEL
jgi:competence protein ComEA